MNVETQRVFHVRQEQSYSYHYKLQESEHPLGRLIQASNYLARRPIMLSRNRYRKQIYMAQGASEKKT